MENSLYLGNRGAEETVFLWASAFMLLRYTYDMYLVWNVWRIQYKNCSGCMFAIADNPLSLLPLYQVYNGKCNIISLETAVTILQKKFLHLSLLCELMLLTHLLRTELLRSWEILSIIVSKVVIADNGDRFDSCTDKKIYQDWLQLGLPWFEVITSNKNIVFLC